MNEEDRLAAIAHTGRSSIKPSGPMVRHFKRLAPIISALFPRRCQRICLHRTRSFPDMVANLAKLGYHVSKFVELLPRLHEPL